MDAQALIRKIQAQREVWLELEPAIQAVGEDEAGTPAKRVKVRRPAETAMFRTIHGSRLDGVLTCVVGWEGFREVDVLPPGVGANDALAFDSALWAEIVADRGEWVEKISEEVIRLIKDHQAKKAQAEKN